MADISQVKLPSGNTYDIKDDFFRNSFWDGLNPTTADYLGQTLPSTRAGINRLADFTGTTASINNHNHLVAQLEMGSFRNLHGELGTTQSGAAMMNTLCYLYLGPEFNNIINTTVGWNDLYLAVVDSNATTPTTFAGRFMYRRGVLGAKNLTAKGIYSILWNGLDWNIIGDLAQAGQIAGLEQRIETLQNGMVQGVQYAGVLSTATGSPRVSDGSTVSALVRSDGRMMAFDDGTQGSTDPSDLIYGPGAIVIQKNSQGTSSTEYIWNGSKWQELGSNTDNFGDFAYADTGSGTYSKATAVSKPTFSGTPATITVTGKPTGSVSKPTFSGTPATITSKGNLAAHTIKIPYTPAGTVGIDTNISTASKDLTVITGVGTLPTTISQNVVTSLPTTTGKLVSAFSTASINKVTGRGSLPTTSSQDYVTGFSEGEGNTIAAFSTASIGKMTGVGTLPAATTGTVKEVGSLSSQTVTTAEIYSMTSAGTVSTGTVKTISGLGSLPGTESKTFVTGGTGITGVGSLPSSGNATVGTSLTAGTLPTASTGSSWATVTNEVLTLTPVLVSFNAGAFPTLNTTTIKQITGLGSLPTTAALSTSTVRGVSSLGTLPSSVNTTVVTGSTMPTRAATTVVSSVSAASLVTTAEKSVLTGFSAGTLPTCSSQNVVTGITTGSLPTATVTTLNKLTGLGSLMSTSAQNVVTAMTTADRNALTTSIRHLSGVGSLPTTGTESLSYVTAVGATGSLSGTPTTLSYTLPATTITSTASYTPAGTVSQPSFTGTNFNSTGAYTPAGTVSQPTLTTASATVTVSPN